MSDDPHAVRWYRRKDRWGGKFWTKWHGSSNSSFTWCGILIPLAIPGGSFVPGAGEVDDVDCGRCLTTETGARIVPDETGDAIAAAAEAGGES